MALNPANKQGSLNDPTLRANELNDPQFSNEQGYFPYDLTHQSFITPLFGNITPTLHLDTVPGDRFVVRDNQKLILNKIDGNLLSNLNQYVDSFYVPMRAVFPMNYEKLIVNPTKGDDLPNAALPQFPLGKFIIEYLNSDTTVTYINEDNGYEYEYSMREVVDKLNSLALGDLEDIVVSTYISRVLLLATVLSRGQLLDYLDYQLDELNERETMTSSFQIKIDELYGQLYQARYSYLTPQGENMSTLGYLKFDTTDFSSDSVRFWPGSDQIGAADTIAEWRQAISDVFERGALIDFRGIKEGEYFEGVQKTLKSVVDMLNEIFDNTMPDDEYIDIINADANPFGDGQFINLGKVLAYQMCVAQYYTNDTVDNIFNSDLFMQLLRSIMFPSVNGLSSEPTFDFNGVPTEYDYISLGATYISLINDTIPGHLNRQYVWLTIMMLLKRSLRFGDYFSTARPNMLAIGQLGVNVEGGSVSPIDITKNLLMQRYLNACNYVGNKYLQTMASMFSITPSDTGTFPRFISHRKIEITNQITNNTAENQGHQTTNLVGYSDNSAFDVFIDDFGYLISLTSFDVLPVYTTGIDSTWHFSDRFDLYNPMLQNIGDQAIRSSELLGNPSLYKDAFGYTMRNSEYKYKLSKAHGAFVNNDLAGFMFKYPVNEMKEAGESMFNLHINPDYIRDKAIYLDRVIPENSGISPAQNYQFVVSCTNEVHAARKIQATPPVLF